MFTFDFICQTGWKTTFWKWPLLNPICIIQLGQCLMPWQDILPCLPDLVLCAPSWCPWTWGPLAAPPSGPPRARGPSCQGSEKVKLSGKLFLKIKTRVHKLRFKIKWKNGGQIHETWHIHTDGYFQTNFSFLHFLSKFQLPHLTNIHAELLYWFLEWHWR